MPNFDGGHYFLSSLIPVKGGLVAASSEEENAISHTHALREILSILPTQNPTEADGMDDDFGRAPFSLDHHTHFCRMVVIDDLAFVGRQHEDAILTAIRKRNPVLPGPVDHLPNDFLALIIDFDAADGSDNSLRIYLQSLWEKIPRVLTAIFQHCEGFNHSAPGESFVQQVINGKVETTMSFNDYYWTGEAGLWKGSPSLPNKLPKVFVVPLISGTIGVIAILWLGLGKGLNTLLIIIVIAVASVWLVKRLIRVGMEPFPTAPRTDLPNILKALYLQRQFIRFMIDNQRSTPQQLQANFRDFLKQHKPQTVEAPSQLPGRIPH
jgi:hypothetical protein